MTIVPFSGSALDRASDRRADEAWLSDQWQSSKSLVWPFWKLQPLVIPEEQDRPTLRAGFLPRSKCTHITTPESSLIFLGLNGECSLFAVEVPSDDDPSAQGLVEHGGYFSEPRAAAQLLPLPQAAIMGQAKALIDWHNRHGFCPNCGTRTAFADGGYRRHCGACAADHFPRTDPVVIMLAVHEDACLVGRSPRFPKGTFSALAGFVEPGETIEEAVAREVFEEAGVKVNNVSYFASQPWPFPSSLMIGCFAEAENRAITIDEKELAEAFWLEKARLRALFAGEPDPELRIPPPLAIAHHLLKRFAEMP